MSTTPTLETLHASMQGHIEDVLRMLADIQSNLEAQQATLGCLRRVLEARNARAVARSAEQAGNSHAVPFPAA
jgi:hypothetical protein